MKCGWKVASIGYSFIGYLQQFSASNAVNLGKSLGKVVAFEDLVENDKISWIFFRVRVSIDLINPLVDGIWILHLNGSKIWVNIKYEKLQSFCYNCGIGRMMSTVEEGNEKYGP